MGMLSGYRVIDFTNFVSGPTCTRLLSDMGAEVIRVERPDKKKGSGPYKGGERTVDLGLMRGKKSITLNIKDKEEYKILLKLIQSADVIVENFRPGVTKRIGIDYNTIFKVKPDIIYTSISGFGQSSPYQNRGAFDLIIQAMSGFMSVTGEADGKPVRAGISMADICSGIEAAFGTVCMLLDREKTGKGNYLDLAMLDTMFAACNNPVTQYFCTGKVAERIGNEHPQDVPWGDFPTKDGTIIIACGRTNTYRDLCKVLGCEKYISDPRFENDAVRLINKRACHEIVGKHTIDWETSSLIEAFNKAGVPCAVINTIDQACRDKSLIARGMIATVKHKTAGEYQVPGSPLKFVHNSPTVTKGAPILGENNREIFENIGMTKEEINKLLEKQQKVRTFFTKFALD